MAALALLRPTIPAHSTAPTVFTDAVILRMSTLTQALRKVRDDMHCQVIAARLYGDRQGRRPELLIQSPTADLVSQGKGYMSIRTSRGMQQRWLVDGVDVVHQSEVQTGD